MEETVLDCRSVEVENLEGADSKNAEAVDGIFVIWSDETDFGDGAEEWWKWWWHFGKRERERRVAV